MQIVFLNPLAWLGLVTLAIPVSIHLLTNQRTRHVPFPTLRFLRQTRLAALGRRAVQDWFLLAIRLLVLAVAVAALAAPVLVSDTRRGEWHRRVARGIVIAPGASRSEVSAIVESERRGAFASATFTPPTRAADGLRDAGLWLDQQPPSAKEVVIVGDLKSGAIGSADLSLVPRESGLRFLPTPTTEGRATTEVRFQEGGALWRADTTLTDAATHVTYTREPLGPAPIAVRAAPGDQAAATQALDAVLARGVDLGASGRRVLMVFEGSSLQDVTLTRPPSEAWMREALAALPGTSGGENDGVLVLQTPVRGSATDAASAIDRVARAVFGGDRSILEPARIAPQLLAEWSRPIGTPDYQNVRDEGDRRWAWGAVLILMAVEMVIRRTRPSARHAAVVVEGSRVA